MYDSITLSKKQDDKIEKKVEIFVKDNNNKLTVDDKKNLDKTFNDK